MVRTSPCYYISPSAISISPNANGSASDLAVNIVKGAKIKVYSQGIQALGWSDSVFQQWTLTGRNRRLADSTKPYTIYARLNKNNKEDGYLVFAPKEADKDGNWLDKYAYVTMQGLATGTANKNSEDYWYIKLGEVSLPTDNARSVTLDTGILGTDQFNTEWNLDPDDMPLRVELSATIDLKDAGDKPYVPWGKELVLRAKLLQGWANTNIQRFHHWTIRRDTGDTKSDTTYNYPSTNGDGTVLSSGRQMPGGNISLSHARGEGDVFNGTVSSLWTVTAWGTKTDSEGVDSSDSSSSSSSSTDSSSSASSSSSLPSDETPVETYEKLAETTINILAETVEQFALELSSGVVNYDPSSDTYSPANGIDVMVRATDQKGDVFKLTNAQLKAAGLSVQYSLTNLNQWNTCTFSGADTDVASANIPIEAFHLQQNVDVRILKIVTPATAETAATTKEIFRSHIALVRNGEDSKEREWIFLRSKTALQFSTDAKDTSKPLAPSLINGGEVKPEEAATGDDTNKNQDGWVPEGWWDEMRGTDSTYHYEYAAYRDYIKGESQSSSSSSGNAAQRGGHWGDFTAPRIWSYYAEDAVSYRCRFTLAGVEVYQLKCAYTGAFRGTLPLVGTLLKRVGSGQEQEVTGKAVVTLKCEGIDYAKTLNTDNPTFTVNTTDKDTADFVQYLNKVELSGLSVSFAVDGENYNFSIPVIREADEDSVKETIDSYGGQKFLRKDHDDETTHKLTMGEAEVKNGLKVDGQTTFGEFSGGELTGQGGRVDHLGNAILQSLTVRGRAVFTELIMNRLSVVESDYNFTENGTIETATKIGDNSYRLVMRKRWDKDITAFKVNDVCYGSVNNLLDTSATKKEVQTCWFKVESVETDTNSLIVSIYDDSAVPDQKNSIPVDGMVVARRGNSKDVERQSSWYLSSSQGGIVLLHGVTKPIVDVTNYAGFIGLSSILKGLYPNLDVPDNDFAFYGDTIYARKFVTIRKGKAEYQKRDRGLFVKGTTYYNGLDPTDNSYVQDEVWYGGIFWQCDITNDGSKPPRWNNTNWTALLGAENWSINFKCSYGIAISVGENVSIVLEAQIWQAEMLLTCQAQQETDYDLAISDVWWTRESKAADGADLDKAGDDAWNALHKQVTWQGGLVINLTKDDFPPTWTAGCRVGFRVHAIVNSVEKTGIFDLN